MQGRIIDPFDAPQTQQMPIQATQQTQPVNPQAMPQGQSINTSNSNAGFIDPFDAPQQAQKGQSEVQSQAAAMPKVPQQNNQTPNAVSSALNNTGVLGFIGDKLLQHYGNNKSAMDEIRAIPDAFINEANNQSIGLNQILMAGLNKLGVVSDDDYKKTTQSWQNMLHSPPMFTSQENYDTAPIGRAIGTGAAYIIPGGALKEAPVAIAAGGKALAEAVPNAATKFIANVAEKPATGYIASGAIANNLQYVPDDQSRLFNTIEGGVAGYGLGKAAEAVLTNIAARKAVRSAEQTASASTESGKLPPVKTQASGQSADAIPTESGGASGTNTPIFNEPNINANPASLTPDQLRFVKEAEDVKIPFTKGDVTQDFKQQEYESRAAKMQDVGDPLRQFRTNQQQAMASSANTMAQNMGAIPKLEAGENIQGALRNAAQAEKSNISQAYESAKNAPGNDAIVPIDGLKNNIAETLNDFGDAIPSPIISKLESHGLTGNNTNPINLTVEKAQQLVKSINRRINASGDPAMITGLNGIKKSIDDAVSLLGQDSGEAANLYNAARAQRLNYANTYEQNDIVQQIIDKKAKFTNYLDPQEIVDKVVKDKGSNLQNLFKIKQALLKPDASGNITEAGQNAWNNLKGSTVHDLLVDSVKGADTGTPFFDTARFNREMDRVGDNALKMLLSPQEFTDLKKFQRVISQIQRKAPGAVNNSNTATSLVNMMSSSPLLQGYFAGILKGVARNITKYHDVGKINAAINGGKSAAMSDVKEKARQSIQQSQSPILRLLSGYGGFMAPNLQGTGNNQ